MQPAANRYDIHTILGRFETWAGKKPGDGNGHKNGNAPEEVREISYEEAIRQYRSRHAGPSDRPAPAPNCRRERLLRSRLPGRPLHPQWRRSCQLPKLRRPRPD